MNKSEENILDHIVRRMSEDRAVDAPADAINYAKNLFKTRSVRTASVLERVMAVLKIDLAPNRAAFGERSAADGQARQMLFEAGDNAIDLRIKAVGKQFEVHGQILGDGFDDGAIEIANPLHAFSAKIDEISEFTIFPVPSGNYNITICGHRKELVIEEFILR